MLPKLVWSGAENRSICIVNCWSFTFISGWQASDEGKVLTSIGDNHIQSAHGLLDLIHGSLVGLFIRRCELHNVYLAGQGACESLQLSRGGWITGAGKDDGIRARCEA